jgi:hypothetical protein
MNPMKVKEFMKFGKKSFFVDGFVDTVDVIKKFDTSIAKPVVRFEFTLEDSGNSTGITIDFKKSGKGLKERDDMFDYITEDNIESILINICREIESEGIQPEISIVG